MNISLNEEIADRIKELRNIEGLTQFELAKKLNISRSVLAKYETAAGIPSIPVLVDLAKFFRVSTDYILGLVD